MVIASSEALIDALRQYGLLTQDQLEQVPFLVQGGSGNARSLAKILGQRGWLTIYQINQLLAGRAQQLVYGPYHVLDVLGQGGLSQVFKARHSEHLWLAALKVLRGSPGQQRRQAAILARNGSDGPARSSEHRPVLRR